MQHLIKDFFQYSVQQESHDNKRGQIMHFLLKDYPAYLWEKPSLKRVFVFPFLLVAACLYGYKQK